MFASGLRLAVLSMALATPAAWPSDALELKPCWLRGHPLEEISRRANEVAAYVCTQAGATPRLPVELTRGERS